MIETPTPDYFTLVFGLVPILISSIGTLFVKNWLDRRAISKVDDDDYDIRFTVADIQKMSVRIEDLIEKTTATRFLLLKAENGKVLTNATAILSNYDQHDLLELYQHAEIDEYYREMLKKAENANCFAMETATMPPAKLRGFYEDEGVTFSNCYFLGRLILTEEKTVIFYCTCAKEQAENFTNRELHEFERLTEFLKRILKSEMERILKLSKKR